MCGIVGYIGKEDARKVIISSLMNMKYRGCDNSGVALLDNNKFKIFKDVGTIDELEPKISSNFECHFGVGHTRWATTGAINKSDAHPHLSIDGRFIIVHNGNIENYKQLKEKYISNQDKLLSTTDTEIIVNLISLFAQKKSVLESINETIKLLKGSYAILLIDTKDNNKIYFAKNKTPLIIGKSENEIIFSSDLISIVDYANQYNALHNETFGYYCSGELKIYNKYFEEKNIKFKNIGFTMSDIEAIQYQHLIPQEIYRKPKEVVKLIQDFFDKKNIGVSQDVINIIKYNVINLV